MATRVLYLAANPDLDLDMDLEVNELRAKMSHQAPGWFFDLWPRIQYDQLVERLVNTRPDIVHFAGHGTDQGGARMYSVNGGVRVFEPQQIVEAIEVSRHRPKLLVWNSCHSNVLAQQLLAHAGVVIGVSGEVEDAVARTFTSQLYWWLSRPNMSIARSFEIARTIAIAERSDDVTANFSLLRGQHVDMESSDPSQTILERCFGARRPAPTIGGAVLAASDQDFEALADALGDRGWEGGSQVDIDGRHYEYFRGESDRHEVVLGVATRTGQLWAASAIAAIQSSWRPRHVILCGVAERVSDGVEDGDVVIADTIVYYETAIRCGNGWTHRGDQFFVSRHVLDQSRQLIHRHRGGHALRIAQLGSGEKRSLDPMAMAILGDSDIVGVDRDGAAAAILCEETAADVRPTLAVVRGMRGHAAAKSDASAAVNSACAAVDLVSRLLTVSATNSQEPEAHRAVTFGGSQEGWFALMRHNAYGQVAIGAPGPGLYDMRWNTCVEVEQNGDAWTMAVLTADESPWSTGMVGVTTGDGMRDIEFQPRETMALGGMSYHVVARIQTRTTP